MDTAQFIAAETEYFRPMLERNLNATAAERERWRTETIRERQKRISLEVFDTLNGTVRYGPFKGLKLERDTWWGSLDLGSQCLGLYELEILNFIAQIEPGQFSNFIDIGAADGYYATGMLKSGKFPKAICFEQSEKGRDTIARNWRRNGSEGVLEIYADANPETVSALSPNDLTGALVMVDIEGAEFDLLLKETLGIFRRSTIIIEIHNWIENFMDRYAAFLEDASWYFDVECFERIDRPTSGIPELRDFTDDNRLLLVSERRPCLMRFLKLSPRAS